MIISCVAAKVVDGKPVRFSFDELSPFMVFYRVPGTRMPRGCSQCCARALGALLLTALLWPITAIVRRRYGATLALDAKFAARLPLQQDRRDPESSRAWACGR